MEKTSKFELFKAIVVLSFLITGYIVVSNFVLDTFWKLVGKLFKKITK